MVKYTFIWENFRVYIGILVDKKKMQLSVNEVVGGTSIRGIAVMTLKRYIRKTNNAAGEIDFASNYRQSQIFSPRKEKELVNFLTMTNKLYHGLTSKTVRHLAYQYACANRKKFQPKWTENESEILV